MIATTLEQSRKLVELGIDPSSADMFYCHGLNLKTNNWEYDLTIIDELFKPDIGDVPAWSLSALLGLMPKLYEFENDPDDGGCQPNLCKGWDNNQWHIVYRPSIYITEWYDNPLDAAFEMVCWLKENKHI